jgi:hypothetical protein
MVRQNAILATGLPAILAAAQRAARGKRHSADVAGFMLDAECGALGHPLAKGPSRQGSRSRILFPSLTSSQELAVRLSGKTTRQAPAPLVD